MNNKDYEKKLVVFEKKLLKYVESIEKNYNPTQLMIIKNSINSTIDSFKLKSKNEEVGFLMQNCFDLLEKSNILKIKETNPFLYIDNSTLSVHEGIEKISIYTGSIPSNMFNLGFKDKQKESVKIHYFWIGLKISGIWGSRVNRNGEAALPIILEDRAKAYFLNMLLNQEIESNLELKNKLTNHLKNTYVLYNIFTEILKSPQLKIKKEDFVSQLKVGGFDEWNLHKNIYDRLEDFRDFFSLTTDSKILNYSNFYNNLKRKSLIENKL